MEPEKGRIKSWERKDDWSQRKEELKELGKEARLKPEKGRIKRVGKGRTFGAGERKN